MWLYVPSGKHPANAHAVEHQNEIKFQNVTLYCHVLVSYRPDNAHAEKARKLQCKSLCSKYSNLYFWMSMLYKHVESARVHQLNMQGKWQMIFWARFWKSTWTEWIENAQGRTHRRECNSNATLWKIQPDDTAHKETNYIKLQNIQFSLCLSDYSENAHDCENPKKHWYQTSLSPKNKWRKSAKYTSFALQGRLFTSLWWLKTTLKKKEQNQEGQYSSKQFIQIAGHKTFTTMSSKLSLYEHSQT